MSVFASFGILILSALIATFLMLTPSAFANFLHYTSGKYSRQKADDLSLFFILGAETMVVLLFIFTATIVWALPSSIINPNNPFLLWTLAGVFLALAIITFCFYFKKDGQLFVSRKTAKKYIEKPKSINCRSDAFVFGLASGIPELLFTFPLYFISVLAITNISFSSPLFAGLIVLYAILTITPLFIIRFCFRTNCNLASFLRFRLKNYSVFRIFLSLLYLMLMAILIISGSFNL